MSTITKPVTESADELAKRFADLLAHCHRDTAHSSKLTDRVKHPAFREIVAMGEKAVPLLLASIEKGSVRWTPILALEEIAVTLPAIPAESDGKVDQIVAAWIAWGREQGYRW